ncbi:MAG: hypothetical protein VR73_10310 [Gammaproteobacteria bacterium BRH_c0]|nr:MAG: hypothetical protein VR73_10310 [Gammaproteobacteria bacterium BRH_c0]
MSNKNAVPEIDTTISAGGHRTANRVLDILELLADMTGNCSLRDMSLALEAPKSSLLPLLRTLTERGYISHDDHGYQLATKVLELGSGLDTERDLRNLAHAELVALRNLTAESTILARLTSDRKAVIYIDKVEGLHRILAAAKIGETRPLHATSSGRLLLAHMPAAERDATIDALQLTRYTDKTIVDKAELRAEIDRILSQGYCINIDQSVLGHCAIAAPIRDHWGHVIAASVLSAPTDRVKDKLPSLTQALQATASAISRQLGYKPRGKAAGKGTDQG